MQRNFREDNLMGGGRERTDFVRQPTEVCIYIKTLHYRRCCFPRVPKAHMTVGKNTKTKKLEIKE